MSLVDCKACGTQIARSAKSCPKCGAPRKSIGAGKVILVAFIVLVVASASSAKQKREEQHREVQTGAALDVSAAELFKDYAANEVSADDRYRGKVLRVSGTVESINKNIVDDPYVMLRAGGDFDGVHCSFDSTQTSSLASLSRGQRVTLRCRGNGKMIGSPMLHDCVLDQ